MNIYIYSRCVDEQFDIAAVKAASKTEAISKLKKYFICVKKSDLKELTFKNSDGSSVDLMILSDY